MKMSMKKHFAKSTPVVVLAFAFILLLTACKTKQDAAVLKIWNGNQLVESVSPQEFLAVFMKNNLGNEPLTQESIEEYLDLFINYKLKVSEAEALGMDTIPSFITELQGYREQLAKPYLNDQSVTDKLINEAWDRMQLDIRASHILVSLPRDAAPKDTLAAYQRIANAKELLLKGADFASVAAEYSDDPYARDVPPSENTPGRKGNKGDLGYFTVFDMVYPFENAAYSTPVGEVSEITRSIFGYHLLKVTDRKPAMGRAFLAHIFVPHPRSGLAADSVDAERRIREIYQEYVKNNETTTFEEIARLWSEDKSTSANGGVLRWFNTHGLVPEFVAALKTMEIDQVSEPIMTLYGWHIIKLLNQEIPGPYEKELPNIKQRLTKDSRSLKSREEAIAQIRTQFGYKEYPGNKPLILKYVDTLIFAGSWKMTATGMEKNKKPLMKIGDETYTVADFGKWVEKRQSRTGSGDLNYFINERFNEFSDEKVLAHKENRLESLYPEFKALMQEYRDGILLFDLMDQRVWTRAIQDSAGLQAFYEKHKHEHLWDTRADASVYICKTQSVAHSVRNMVKSGKSDQEILDTINKISALELVIKKEKFQAGDHLLVDAVNWAPGITEVRPTPTDFSVNPGFFFVNIAEVLPPQEKQLSEVRGLMISQYQEQLEKDWLDELKARYRVEVIQSELEKIYQK
jgi:peptidyl-prolyl cis-trans isomerase SurA